MKIFKLKVSYYTSSPYHISFVSENRETHNKIFSVDSPISFFTLTKANVFKSWGTKQLIL